MDSNPLHLLLVSILLLHVNGQQLPSQSLPTLSGYLPITTTTNSSSSAIYYAYYEAQTPISPLAETPIIIWLQGGPGCSSLIGNFFELGPYRLDPHNPSLQLVPNPGSWNRIFGLLFLDNPIGTGFSIAANQAEIPTNQQTVAKHLYSAITKFTNLDPLFKSRPVYITGESYAGKYVPAIGAYILKRNSMRTDHSSRGVNLAGVAIGNGLTDPETQVATHADNAYFSGFINNKQRARLQEAQMEAINLAKERKWSEATDARNKVLKMLINMTGLATLYDFSREVSYETDLVTKFLKSEGIKKLLNANTEIEWEECSDVVGSKLHEDVMKSVKDKVEYILSKSRVLLYQGHRDLRDGVVSVEAWVKTLNWGQIDKYLAAERNVWRVNGKVAGYVQRWDKLSQVVVLGAGHLVPSDQSMNSQAMIEDWVLQKGMFCFNGEVSKPLLISANMLCSSFGVLVVDDIVLGIIQASVIKGPLTLIRQHCNNIEAIIFKPKKFTNYIIKN